MAGIARRIVPFLRTVTDSPAPAELVANAAQEAEEPEERFNPDLLRLIPGDARTVLEVGCATGKLGLHYKRLNPQATYLGIDCDREATEVAATRLDRVYLGNAEDRAIAPDIAPGTVDCLIYGDTLEHFVDPWATLRWHLDWLAPGGQVVACIPNVQHWTVLRDLLRGQWRYGDSGLLDRTHLRFFTEEGVRQLFTGAGLTIYELQTRGYASEKSAYFRHLLAPLLEKLQIDPEVFTYQTDAFQYIVRACRAVDHPSRRLFIQTLVMETLACKRVRVAEPNDFLSRIPGVRIHSSDRTAALGLETEQEQPIFVWQRVILDPNNGGVERQKKLLDRGYLTIVEVDDDPMRWPETDTSNAFTYRACHAIQTSTEPLAQYLRQLNPYVGVFANQIAELPPPREPAAPGAPVTLFFGALNREEDWYPLLAGLNRLLIAGGDRLRVEVLHDKQFFEALQTPHKHFRPFSPYADYCATLSRSDVAILPLNPTRFNSMKSDLKFIECAAHGAVVLASPVVYGESLIDGVTGLFFRNPDEFEMRLAALLTDGGLRDRLRRAAYDWVKTHRMLANHYRDRYNWYCDLLDRRAELDEALRRRVPALFD